MVETVFWILTAISLFYWLLVWWSVESFFRARSVPADGFKPSVSILKPVKGLDPEAWENFASFCQQDYGEYELLFGVSDPSDPAVELVEKLRAGFRQRSIGLIVAPEKGSNPKSSILHELALAARHEVLVISDSDMRVTPDYLRRVVAPLADPQTGVVTCLYRSRAAATLGGHLAALYVESDFLPSVIAANKVLGVRSALGATIALRRDDLKRSGGYASIADYLTDDYQIAAGIASLGLKLRLSDYVVLNVMGATGFRELWHREIRWARGIRTSCPWRYSGLWLTFATPLAGGLVASSGVSGYALGALAAAVLLRGCVAWRMPVHLGQPRSLASLAWLPVRDCLSALIWCAGLVGRRITWRGRAFSLLSDGRLEREPCLVPKEQA
jgi:ceramide glucosyltransferase